jgi:predicted  nucleic acid-binding Zn-ribbon protein
MDKNFYNLETIEAELFNIEYNIDLVNINLARAESDITTLQHLQLKIEENIDALKHNGIPLIAEFKRAKEDLDRVKLSLVTLTNNREVFNKQVITLQESFEKCKNRKTLAIKFGQSKIVQGNFGSKNGRQD